MRLFFLFSFLFLGQAIFAQNEYPEINNLSATFDEVSQTVTINYDLFDAEGDEMKIDLFVSDNGGETYSLDVGNAVGDVGASISAGNGKSIIWNATGLLTVAGDYRVKVVADDLFQLNIQEIVDQVDSAQLRSNLEFIEGTRHRNANPSHLAAIKDSIEARFLLANLDTYREDFLFGSYTGQNIIGRLEGTAHSDSTYIVDGHFDTVDDSPGADDNGSAIAGMLEALRVLAPYNFSKTICFIGFDLEEAGLLGSFDYTANGISEFETVKGVFNMEMIGYYTEEPNSQIFPPGFDLLYPQIQADLMADQFRGNFITNIGDPNSVSLQMAYNEAAAQYVPDLKIVSIVAPASWATLTPDFGRSDHAPFWLADIPALMLTDGANFRNPNYHTSNDLLTTLDFNFMTDVVKAVVGTIAEEAGIQHSTIETTQFSVLTNSHNALDCGLQISPIPVDDNLQLFFNDCNFEKLTIQLFDTMGRLVLLEEVPAGFSIHISLDLTSLIDGLYILQLSDGKRKLNRKVLLD